ncbi:TIGR03619 family F420-dependent LLM class oxidoreductase [Nocardioides soli]|uniref:Putative F420-dependent oxidoreductase n=1 Tax=Nocardioides soli TaxID=1036020 RepID=A0A7W4Z3I3_9ACTN|nr:TIGR03619 family F420-dependent LLM class oxidoreductase [Nocardioides soli]MBB3043745.1 putative F420-dependent oxidoreductase [Nocardioides soli]
MRFTFQFPMHAVGNWQTWAGDGSLAEIAVAAEEVGFSAVSATDHPFPGDRWLSHGGHQAFDPFVALSFMAAATERIRLLTLVLVAPYRNPYLAANSAMSLDVLSRGRLIVGIGAGYQRAEMDALGASYEARGATLDAVLGTLRRPWSGDVVRDEDGPFPAPGNRMLPRPWQPEGPPVWVGGNGAAARRRVRDLADGWLPFEQPAERAKVTDTPSLDAASLPEAIDAIAAGRVERGRDPHFDVCFTPLLSGSAPERAEKLGSIASDLAGTGVTHLAVTGRAASLADCIAELELLGEVVRHGPGGDRLPTAG